MSIKMLREDLCRRQVQAPEWPSDIASAVDVLINMIDRHRPLASDGKHGDLHTDTCGCEDRPSRPEKARPDDRPGGA